MRENVGESFGRGTRGLSHFIATRDLELPANQLIKVFSLVHGWWLLPVPCSRSRHCSHGTEVFGTLVRSCWSLRSYKQVGTQDPTDRLTVLLVWPSVLPREALAAFHGESLEARDPRFCGGVPFLLVRLRQIVRVNRRHAHCSSPRKDPGFTRGYSAACSDSWQSAQKACVPPTYCVASLSRRHSTTPPLAPTA